MKLRIGYYGLQLLMLRTQGELHADLSQPLSLPNNVDRFPLSFNESTWKISLPVDCRAKSNKIGMNVKGALAFRKVHGGGAHTYRSPFPIRQLNTGVVPMDI